jgi:hypothetical protein
MASFGEVTVKLDCRDCPCFPEVHTVKEWAELPDKVSVACKWYVYSDYRTDNDVNIPRFKFGDGKTLISKLPFVTAAITDNDQEMWDRAVMCNTEI